MNLADRLANAIFGDRVDEIGFSRAQRAELAILFDGKPIPPVKPRLAREIGLHKAVALQQTQYLLTHWGTDLGDGEMWIYGLYDKLQREFPRWDGQKVSRIIRWLEKHGYLVAGHGRGRAKRFTINYEKLPDLYLFDYIGIELAKVLSAEAETG